MASFETTYWWYRGLHGAIGDVLRDNGVTSRSRILDAGCGTGGNLASLNQRFNACTFGFDFSPHAAPFWAERGVRHGAIASINEIPYADDTFDAVTSIDVLESDAVDEAQAVGELWRVTKPGGVIVLVVPAYRWLLTEQHHRAVHASRRYTRSEAVALLRRHPVEILRATHVFALLFPPIAAYRLALKWFDHPAPDAPPRSELNELPAPVNELLAGVMRAERFGLQHVNAPFGSSILVAARKAAA